MRLVAVLACLCAPAAAMAQADLSPADQAAAFGAAGFNRVDGQWRSCDDPGTASYTPGAIESAADLDGDGLPEAIISESSSFCYGMQGAGYAVVSKRPDGSWKPITSGSGIPLPLASRGADGWPDLAIGGPGFCFAVERWNGDAYVLDRHEYEGKACKPAE